MEGTSINRCLVQVRLVRRRLQLDSSMQAGLKVSPINQLFQLVSPLDGRPSLSSF
jgi:hypothetical protein